MKGVKNQRKFLRDTLMTSYLSYSSMERQRVGMTKYGRSIWVKTDKVALGLEFFSGEWHISQLIALSYLR
ncbi:hypothetical protein M900_1131 [Bacteriovorax sp. Seq25_V]|nr:hypothetical protein M900_1131 [Bacteriovorax sp. Seq25_V]